MAVSDAYGKRARRENERGVGKGGEERGAQMRNSYRQAADW